MSLLDPRWKYTHSTATDIRKTFARVRKEQAQAQEKKQQGGRSSLPALKNKEAA